MAVVRQIEQPGAPRIVGGRWELLSPLATGGMGTLYVGRHLQTGRRAAVKVIERASPEVMARFKLEASVSATLNHPGIVDVFDADTDAATGDCFIAMELLEGHTLRGVMDDPEATPREVLGHLMAALEPLVAAHENGFVHRDLKPENIFVREGKPRGVKLLDFGIVAQQSDARLTRDGAAMGTPHYMSPEQATSARDAGPASDIWSMGVMMYEAIRGEVPFAGQTSNAVIIQACTCPHVPLDAVVPGVDPAIARLIDSCLEKEPQKRPQNARALLDALRDLLRPNSLPVARPSIRAPREPEVTDTSSTTGVRPSLRTRSIVNASHLLAASGVVCGLSAIALPLAGLAAPGTVLFCAAVGGGLLVAAGARVRSLKELAQQPRGALQPNATIEIQNEKRPRTVEHPTRGPAGALVKLDLYADLSCAITRRACQRVLALRAEHPDEIVVIYRPYWDPEKEGARAIAEFARAIFEREGPDVFWGFFDRVIATPRKVTSDLLLQFAEDAGAEMYGLRRALRSHAHRRSLQICREDAEVSGVTESPTVMINEGPLGGSITEDRLHWAYVDAKSARERRRVVELGATRIGDDGVEEPRAVRAFLVRYRGARNAPATLRRTREQAYERACKLVTRAQMPGSDFADIALRFADNLFEHEELESRLSDPLFADATRALRVGQLSEPIECDEGYQVLQRVS